MDTPTLDIDPPMGIETFLGCIAHFYDSGSVAKSSCAGCDGHKFYSLQFVFETKVFMLLKFCFGSTGCYVRVFFRILSLVDTTNKHQTSTTNCDRWKSVTIYDGYYDGW